MRVHRLFMSRIYVDDFSVVFHNWVPLISFVYIARSILGMYMFELITGHKYLAFHAGKLDFYCPYPVSFYDYVSIL